MSELPDWAKELKKEVKAEIMPQVKPIINDAFNGIAEEIIYQEVIREEAKLKEEIKLLEEAERTEAAYQMLEDALEALDIAATSLLRTTMESEGLKDGDEKACDKVVKGPTSSCST